MSIKASRSNSSKISTQSEANDIKATLSNPSQLGGMSSTYQKTHQKNTHK